VNGIDEEPLDPRVAELLSAHLDGAVSPEERATAEQWLERSAAARAEYESLAAVKAALGGMGEVEPPFGFYDRMLRQASPTPEVTSAVDAARTGRRSRRGWVAGGVAVVAAAAAALVVLAAGGGSSGIRPPVEEVAAGTADDVQTLRRSGEEVRTLVQEADEVDWDELPDGERDVVAGADTWVDLTTDGDEERVIVSDDGIVVTLAADGIDPDDLIQLGLDLLDDEAPDE
jgi:hypothetical protein